MNKNKVEDQIPISIELIKEFIEDEQFYKKSDENFGKIPNEYKGYISNFGASINQSGLIATVAFFESDDSQAKEDRKILTKLILKVMCKYKNLELEDSSTLLKYVIENRDNINVKEDIVNTAIAVKLAMKVFTFSENNEG